MLTLAGFFEWMASEREQRALRRSYARLSDHLLADIGVRRDQLDSAVRAASRSPAVAGPPLRAIRSVGPSLQGCG